MVGPATGSTQQLCCWAYPATLGSSEGLDPGLLTNVLRLHKSRKTVVNSEPLAGAPISGTGPTNPWWGQPQVPPSSFAAGLTRHRWARLKDEPSVC